MVRDRHLARHKRVLGLAPAFLRAFATARRTRAHLSRHASREASIMNTVLHPQELIRRIGPDLGPQLRLIDNESSKADLFRGKLRWLHLRSGLSLHCSDCLELSTFSTQLQIQSRFPNARS